MDESLVNANKSVILDKIVSGVPIPPAALTPGNGNRNISLADMQVGDSVAIAYQRRGSIGGMIAYHKKARSYAAGQKFTTRVLIDPATGEKYVRLWRIA